MAGVDRELIRREQQRSERSKTQYGKPSALSKDIRISDISDEVRLGYVPSLNKGKKKQGRNFLVVPTAKLPILS